MPISRKTYISLTALLLLLGLAALLGIVAASLVLVERTREQFGEVVAARQVRSGAADLLSMLQDMETGQRGYLLTEDEAYLEPYRQASGRVVPQFQALRGALEGYPELAPVLEQLSETLSAKLNEMERSIELFQGGERGRAVVLIESGRGNDLMERLRGDLARLRESAEVRLDLSVARQERSARLLNWVSILGGAVVVLVVAGAAWMIVVYTRDLLRARQDVERLNEELEERVRDRTAALGRANEEIQRFAYIVTHDLRAPLVNIMGFTAELETSLASLQAYVAKVVDPGGKGEGGTADEDPATAEARTAIEQDLPEAIDFIRSSTRKMDGLINAILKISRDGRRPLKPERLELQDLLGTQLDSIRHQIIESDGTAELEVQVETLVSDRLSLEQVFGNLLDNAVKYQEPARPLALRVSVRPLGSSYLAVEIEDNGRGIAPQDHERVFELFRRSGSQDRPGEGIGLAHVRTLVRSLGGDITLRSEFGRGSTFRVQLPRDLQQYLRSRSQ